MTISRTAYGPGRPEPERSFVRFPVALIVPVVEPVREVCQRPGIPPERHATRTVELAMLGAIQEVRSCNADADVAEPQPANFTGPQAAAAGLADDCQVHLHVGQTGGAALQVAKHRSQFLAG